MHEVTVTASSVRKDGKGFKATLPEYGEVWLSLPDSLTGTVEWKKTYDIAFVIKPGIKGDFYNVTKLKEHGAPAKAPNVPALNGGPDTPVRPADVGPHGGMWEQLSFKALLTGKTESEVIIMGIKARQAAREILRADLDATLDLEDTFDSQRLTG